MQISFVAEKRLTVNLNCTQLKYPNNFLISYLVQLNDFLKIIKKIKICCVHTVKIN